MTTPLVDSHENGKMSVTALAAAAGTEWSIVSKKYYEPDREVVGKLIKEDAEAFAKQNNITPRDCK